jgi:SAM-dependent methyltransferase
MGIRLRPLVVGIATYLPGVSNLTMRHTGGTISARYCYATWLGHLRSLEAYHLPVTFESVIELGPGDSLGLGLAALLSGAKRYVALDVVRYAEGGCNLAILDELVTLFRSQTPPADDGTPFPSHILTAERLARGLAPERIARLAAALRGAASHEEPFVSYVVPWHDADVIARESVDLVISHAVMQYPRDLKDVYTAMYDWLRPGGVMVHVIDFRSHLVTTGWNEHWACPEPLWRLAMGRRRNPLNRAPHSVHLGLLRDLGFRLVADVRVTRPSSITRSQLTRRFRGLSDQDLVTSTALMLSVKAGSAIRAEPPLVAAPQ